MNIVIIEDERLTAEDLATTLQAYDESLTIQAKLLAVKSSIEYFKTHEAPDLIFSDIRLGDGLSFEIFKEVQVHVPVIFCTAYDEYALTAFKSNGIDYLLKPFTMASVSEAMDRFYRITKHEKQSGSDIYSKILDLFEQKNAERLNTILVHYKEKILPIETGAIAALYLENEMVHLVTFDHKVYFPGKSLEEMELILGTQFFRANRQVIINRKAVVDVSTVLSRKLIVNLKVKVDRTITVSKEKSTLFLEWLAGG